MVRYLSRFLLLIRVGTRLKGESLIELEFGMLVLRRRETGVLGGEPSRSEEGNFFSRFGEESVHVRDTQETSAAASSVSRFHSRAWSMFHSAA